MKSSQIKVSEIGEKGLIERIIEKSKTCSIYGFDNDIDLSNFATSIGDDSALTSVDMDDNSYLVTSTDMLIQSSHFPKGMTYFQMGYKSVVVNVSDLASMGAENIGFLLNIAIPKDTLLDDFDDLICGVGTAIGQVDKDKALMKYGFEKGDLVCISDELGYAALGFELLALKEKDQDLYQEKIDKINQIDSTIIDLALLKALKPEAKYSEGHILREHNTSNNRISATDITDGLASEFYEILNSDKKYSNNTNPSNSYSKGIRIYEDKLPVEEEFKEIANILGLTYLDLFLHVGEDFEFLFTINEELKDQLSTEMNYYVIGEITDDNTVEIVLSNGRYR